MKSKAILNFEDAVESENVHYSFVNDLLKEREMKLFGATLFAVMLAATATAHAGKNYEGSGSTVQAAMEAAMDTAEKRSPAKCLCKNEGPMNIEEACRKSEKLDVYICKACGSNHKGSCTNKTDLMKKLGL